MKFLPKLKLSLTSLLVISNIFFILYFLFFIFDISPVRATISNASRVIPFQGTLTDSSGNYVADGNYSITFAIYTAASGGSATWSETKTVAVSNGAFSANIGSSDANGVNMSLDTPPYYLGIKVGSNAEMSPRVQLGFAPHAMSSYDLYNSSIYIKGTGVANELGVYDHLGNNIITFDEN